ncbi:Short-chain dehydrogenase/reductase SDR [Neofusicoccum parvum]|nr:Short-chain dehydrogenase/reductase SDR [Neofusicoccum parvum]
MPVPYETEYTHTYHHASYPAISPTRPALSAANKTILISGGGRGLGTAIVAAFAAAGAAHIVVTGRNAASLEAVCARTAAAHPATTLTPVAGDVTRAADVARAFAAAKGPVDVLVANAGYLATVAPVPPAAADGEGADDVVDDWWRAFEVNVKGVLLLARRFLANASPGAVFLNVSAAVAHLNPAVPGFSAYAGSKLGTARVVETLQRENPGFRFFNIQPGVVRTDMLEKSGLELLPEEDKLPIDEPELPGHFLVWLASPEAEWLKGKWLWANWDVDELKARKEEILTGNKLVTGLVGWA